MWTVSSHPLHPDNLLNLPDKRSYGQSQVEGLKQTASEIHQTNQCFRVVVVVDAERRATQDTAVILDNSVSCRPTAPHPHPH
ncbi:hypothetical protein E2C01_003090 [Portunus trituberculatus]|uniref:Uncharacterized protein n=1 Tax=Portunus trituberculatus TaxID=210409 RepID=A0A5B7CSK3_PORTR|nr:hypothetical protein [Portunus trituberculatus]